MKNIDLLKVMLIDLYGGTEYKPLYHNTPNWRMWLLRGLDRLLRLTGFAVTKIIPYDHQARLEGKDWPARALTMIGKIRLDNIEKLVKTVVEENIPGDLIECGVWRGGACIFIKSLLDELGGSSRMLYVADSFQGLPTASGKYEEDKEVRGNKLEELAVSAEEVGMNFRRFNGGQFPDGVIFLKGWFCDTLPTVNGPFSLIRLDGDMYESTMDGLVNLYPKLSTGGFIIIDDYGLEPCRKAVDNFRQKNGITEPLVQIDWTGVYWRKTTTN